MLELPIAAGEHTIHLENTGADWIHIRDFTLTPYAPQLAVLGKGSNDFAVLYIYRRDQSKSEPITGKISVPGLADGNYRATWWDTYKGMKIKEETLAVSGLQSTLTTPPIAQDVALWIKRAE